MGRHSHEAHIFLVSVPYFSGQALQSVRAGPVCRLVAVSVPYLSGQALQYATGWFEYRPVL